MRHRFLSAFFAFFLITPVVHAQEASDWVVLFVSMRSGEGDLYAVDLVTLEEWKVYGTDAPEGAPRLDAARERIVHHRFDGPNGAPRLFSGDTLLFDDPNGEVPPSWSPDGERIVYASSRNGQTNLFTASADGSGEVQLTDTPAEEKYPVWSNDGQHLAWLERAESGWDVMIAPADDVQASTSLLTLERYAGHPIWAPDGSVIALDSMVEFDADVVLVDVANPDDSVVIRRENNDLVPAFSPDGRTIVFASSDENGNWDVWSYNRDTDRFKQLTTDPSFDGGPVVIPKAWLPVRSE